MNDAKRGRLNLEIKTNDEIPHPIGKTLPKEETILYKCGPSRGGETFQNKAT